MSYQTIAENQIRKYRPELLKELMQEGGDKAVKEYAKSIANEAQETVDRHLGQGDDPIVAKELGDRIAYQTEEIQHEEMMRERNPDRPMEAHEQPEGQQISDLVQFMSSLRKQSRKARTTPSRAQAADILSEVLMLP